MKQAEADNTPKDLPNRFNRAELTIGVDHSVFIERGNVWVYDSEDTTKRRLLLVLHQAEENGEDFARHNRVDSIQGCKAVGDNVVCPVREKFACRRRDASHHRR